MKKIQNYVTGQWTEGTGEGVPMYDAVTGDVVGLSDTTGLDFAEIFQYFREIQRSEEHTSELQSRFGIVCRLLLEKKNRHSRPDKAIQQKRQTNRKYAI